MTHPEPSATPEPNAVPPGTPDAAAPTDTPPPPPPLPVYPPARPPTALTLLKFLFGSSAAIRDLAASRWTLPLGIVLVFTGALARHYDGAYLLGEPKAYFRGIVTALVLSSILYLLFYGLGRGYGERQPAFFAGWRSFVGVYLMTAPMAWLYGIPYERFLSAGNAVGGNLTTLQLVSLWRVLLISRVISVLFNNSFIKTTFVVLLFGDVVAVAGLALAPTPLVNLMAQLRLPAEAREIAMAMFWARMLTTAALVILVPVGLGCFGFSRPRWWRADGSVFEPVASSKEDVPRSLLALVTVAVAFWAVAMILVQPEQRNRYHAEYLLTSGRFTEAFDFLRAKSATDFPPAWDPPPRIAWKEHEPALGAVLSELSTNPGPVWLNRLYADKCRFFIERVERMKRNDQGEWDLRSINSLLRWSEQSAHPAEIVDSLLKLDDRITPEERQLLDALLSALRDYKEPDPPQ